MKIFLSYSHKNKAEADHIDQVLQSANYIIIRDIREVSYKGDLPEYCIRIRECSAAICLISDAFLKSRWCMYEMLQLMKELKFKDKIYPIVLDDARIFSAFGRADYSQFWQDEYRKLKLKADSIDRSASSEIDQELKLFDYIKNEIGNFTTTLGNWLLYKYDDLVKDNFKRFLQEMPDSEFKLLKKNS